MILYDLFRVCLQMCRDKHGYPMELSGVLYFQTHLLIFSLPREIWATYTDYG
jgi:hypothetical protein